MNGSFFISEQVHDQVVLKPPL